MAICCLCACPKKEEPPKVATAEVEFFGMIDKGTTAPAKMLFVVMQEPCSPLPAQPHVLGQSEIANVKLFTELYLPQKSVGHICLFGLDESGRIVASAAHAKNPLTFEGVGEVLVGGLDLKLEALAAPVPRPKGM